MLGSTVMMIHSGEEAGDQVWGHQEKDMGTVVHCF